ncbi:hypothetical protein OHA21_39545 [Actinoplanes sp. NBC_00393]|uniref:hypothetical protein n=1 Tax=Actinoplanes sp. NBC_00393 TaxID=2975953 RepID=UPI002E204435
MSLRRLLALLLLVLTPLPAAAVAEWISAYRALVFWTGTGLILLAVAGGLAWVLHFPGGRVAAVSGPVAARNRRDGVVSAGRSITRTR